MRLPDGALVGSRVVDSPAAFLERALEERLTGYAVVEPGDALLLDADARGVITFEDGVPTLAYEVTADRGGPAALAELAAPGPYSVERYRLPASALEEAHRADELRVPPGSPAEELADAPDLAARTRERAPADAPDDADPSALEAFLADEERVATIREEARAEARRRASEWGLTDHLDSDDRTC